MVSVAVETYYSEVAIVLEIFFGTVVCCITGLVLIGYVKLHLWETPFGLLIMNLLVSDLVNGINAYMQAAYIFCLANGIKAPNLFRTIFSLQALFLWTTLLIVVALNLSRVIAVVAPFRYSDIISLNNTRITLLLIWVTGFIECLFKCYSPLARKYDFYVSDVLFHIILNCIILALAVVAFVCLKQSEDDCNVRRKATKTVVIVSIVFVFTYGYYNYVYIVWMVPGLPQTSNQWLQFTAIGKWSLSLAHMFLLASSLFNGIILGLQPNVKDAIQNIWVMNYRRHILIQNSGSSGRIRTPSL